jgi:hypothetical protein
MMATSRDMTQGLIQITMLREPIYGTASIRQVSFSVRGSSNLLVHRLQVGQLVTIVWEKWEHIIRELREKENVPDVWEGFEYLYDEMKRYRSERGLSEYTYEQFSSVQPSASM